MTPRQANVLSVLGFVALLAVASLTAPRWSGLLSEPTAVFDGESVVLPEEPPPPEGESGVEAGRRINVRLYFEAPDGAGLLAEERTIAFADDLAPQLRTLIEELIRGPESALLPTLPAGTRVLEVFVTGRGVAYVNLSREASALPGGSRAELLAVYSVVNSLVSNFPAVRRVQILLEDRMVTSLGGHLDLSRPLAADMTLVALPPADPSAAGAVAPEAPSAPRS